MAIQRFLVGENGQFSLGDQNSCGAKDYVKAGTFLGYTVTVNGRSLNKGSLIDFLNTKLEDDKKLKKDWFLGLLGGSSKEKVCQVFRSFYPSEARVQRHVEPLPSNPPKNGVVLVRPGEYNIKAQGGTVRTLTIVEPIYYIVECGYVSTYCLKRPLLLMDERDARSISDVIHLDRGDCDHQDSFSRVCVLEVPEELRGIGERGIVIRDVLEERYVCKGDTELGLGPGAKIRLQFLKKPDDRASIPVYEIILRDNTRFLAFSVENLSEDFNLDTPEKQNGKNSLIAWLQEEAGIEAFSCQEHGVIVFHRRHKREGESSEILTPRDVAELLKGKCGEGMKAALSRAMKPEYRDQIEEWAANIISEYASK